VFYSIFNLILTESSPLKDNDDVDSLRKGNFKINNNKRLATINDRNFKILTDDSIETKEM